MYQNQKMSVDNVIISLINMGMFFKPGYIRHGVMKLCSPIHFPSSKNTVYFCFRNLDNI